MKQEEFNQLMNGWVESLTLDCEPCQDLSEIGQRNPECEECGGTGAILNMEDGPAAGRIAQLVQTLRIFLEKVG